MKKIIIGTKGESIDLETLLPTRLLIQASSGGGKSYLLRRIVEQLFGKVQVIIIDPEGEFATLREKFDFVLVGKGGETPTDPRSAAMVAEKLLELNASAICDLYEMKQLDRHRWVRLFLEAVINAPKNLWHSCVFIVDEAHVFCPEKGQGESEAYGSMIDLATRGRKRGFCAIFATQRLGKLSKNASAELQNVLIGSTFQDIDRKRASETLGVVKAEERVFFNEIKLLKPGNFFALGRAISKDRISIQIAPVETTHPEQGKYKSTPPPPTEKVKALLPKLGDLPKEAEEKIKTEAELRNEIRNLKKQLQAAPTQSIGITEFKIKEVPVFKDGQIKRIEQSLVILENMANKHGQAQLLFWNNFDEVAKALLGAIKTVSNYKIPEKRTGFGTAIPDPSQRIVRKMLEPKKEFVKHEGALPIGERLTLTALIQYPNGLERNQLTTLTGYKRSSRDAYLARLAQKGFVESSGSRMLATDTGKEVLPDFEPLPTGEDLQNYWLNRLPEGERAILKILIGAFPNEVERDKLDEATGYKRSSRDAYLARLTAKELVESNGRGTVRASDNLF